MSQNLVSQRNCYCHQAVVNKPEIIFAEKIMTDSSEYFYKI